MIEEAEEDGFSKRYRMNSEGHYQLELRILFIVVGFFVLIAVAYTCFKTMRNFSRATMSLRRKENQGVTET